MPISIAWSTPGAALLVGAGPLTGGYPAAIGAFMLCGLLIVLAGLSSHLARLIAAIPLPLASAMLAGVVFPLCVAPVHAIVQIPDVAAPVIATWLILSRVARRWAVPAALVVAIIAVIVSEHPDLSGHRLTPSLAFTAPSFHLATLLGVGVPLFIVTMASQNVPGMGVLQTLRLPPGAAADPAVDRRPDGGRLVFGAFGVNLAAITAPLVAGPDGGEDRSRRWIGSVTAGAIYVGLGLGAAVLTAFVASSPPLLVESVAGLALLGTLAGRAVGRARGPQLSGGGDRDVRVAGQRHDRARDQRVVLGALGGRRRPRAVRLARPAGDRRVDGDSTVATRPPQRRPPRRSTPPGRSSSSPWPRSGARASCSSRSRSMTSRRSMWRSAGSPSAA